MDRQLQMNGEGGDRVALVCSGGAVKAGAFHMGVALALQDLGFAFPGTSSLTSSSRRISSYVGSSAGALIASYLVAGYSPQEMLISYVGEEAKTFLAQEGISLDSVHRLFKKMNYQKLFKLQPSQLKEFRNSAKDLFSEIRSGSWLDLLAMKWIKWSGLFSTQGIEKHLREEVLGSNRFQDYSSDLFIIATPLDGRKKAVFSRYDQTAQGSLHSANYEPINSATISQACAASAALPIFFSPYGISSSSNPKETLYYIDGDIRDVLSTDVLGDRGVNQIIVSYIHLPYEWTKEIGSLIGYGIPRIMVQTIYQMIHQKIENQISAYQRGKNLMDELLAYCIQEGFSERQKNEILGLAEKKLHFRRDLNVIYIHPDPNDQALFFEDHFHLSSQQILMIVARGYQAAKNKIKPCVSL